MSALIHARCDYRRPSRRGPLVVDGDWKLEFWFAGSASNCGFIRDGSTPTEVAAQLRALADQIEGSHG